jgi:hypothetical protein
MLDPNEQTRVLRSIATAAAKRGLYVAPVGSLYFLFRGEAKLLTKDVDAVVHGKDLKPVDIEVLEEIGKELGGIEVAHDKASVKVLIPQDDEDPIEIDLLRGRAGGKGGFLNRDLLAQGAQRGERVEDNIILYPPEYVLMLKAEAAADRAQRAKAQNEFTQDNLDRAEQFRLDVFTQLRAIEKTSKLNVRHLQDALGLVKENRRAAIAEIIEAATGGRVRLKP